MMLVWTLLGCITQADQDALYDRDGDGVVGDVFGGTDCAPDDPTVFPGAEEVPDNGVDDDCDPTTFDDDTDQDGWRNDGDCAPLDPSIYPGNIEVPYNGVNDDCDDQTLDDDLDGDGAFIATDCDDQDAGRSPHLPETPGNGIDDDCDPSTLDDDFDQDDDGFLLTEDDCDDNNANVNPAVLEIPYNGLDDDCSPLTPDDDADGDGSPFPQDCDDMDPNVSPSADEIAFNSIDDDCDPSTNDLDGDQDGFLPPADCNDGNEDINPDAVEVGDGVDSNCDDFDLLGCSDIRVPLPFTGANLPDSVDDLDDAMLLPSCARTIFIEADQTLTEPSALNGETLLGVNNPVVFVSTPIEIASGSVQGLSLQTWLGETFADRTDILRVDSEPGQSVSLIDLTITPSTGEETRPGTWISTTSSFAGLLTLDGLTAGPVFNSRNEPDDFDAVGLDFKGEPIGTIQISNVSFGITRVNRRLIRFRGMGTINMSGLHVLDHGGRFMQVNEAPTVTIDQLRVDKAAGGGHFIYMGSPGSATVTLRESDLLDVDYEGSLLTAASDTVFDMEDVRIEGRELSNPVEDTNEPHNPIWYRDNTEGSWCGVHISAGSPVQNSTITLARPLSLDGVVFAGGTNLVVNSSALNGSYVTMVDRALQSDGSATFTDSIYVGTADPGAAFMASSNTVAVGGGVLPMFTNYGPLAPRLWNLTGTPTPLPNGAYASPSCSPRLGPLP